MRSGLSCLLFTEILFCLATAADGKDITQWSPTLSPEAALTALRTTPNALAPSERLLLAAQAMMSEGEFQRNDALRIELGLSRESLHLASFFVRGKTHRLSPQEWSQAEELGLTISLLLRWDPIPRLRQANRLHQRLGDEAPAYYQPGVQAWETQIDTTDRRYLMPEEPAKFCEALRDLLSTPEAYRSRLLGVGAFQMAVLRHLEERLQDPHWDYRTFPWEFFVRTDITPEVATALYESAFSGTKPIVSNLYFQYLWARKERVRQTTLPSLWENHPRVKERVTLSENLDLCLDPLRQEGTQRSLYYDLAIEASGALLAAGAFSTEDRERIRVSLSTWLVETPAMKIVTWDRRWRDNPHLENFKKDLAAQVATYSAPPITRKGLEYLQQYYQRDFFPVPKQLELMHHCASLQDNRNSLALQIFLNRPLPPESVLELARLFILAFPDLEPEQSEKTVEHLYRHWIIGDGDATLFQRWENEAWATGDISRIRRALKVRERLGYPPPPKFQQRCLSGILLAGWQWLTEPWPGPRK